MVISYTGALKTWLYAALFWFFAPNVWSVRLPVLLMGAGTIWLTWVWVRRIAGTWAAAVTAVLLATDTIFLMTNTFDWGPVALQHVLLMGGLVPVQIWIANHSQRMLALGFFLWGLGMWDKALLAWPLIGMAVAVVCVFPGELKKRLRPATAAIAVGSFLLGAAPLVWFNIARPGATATTNARFSTEGVGGKWMALRATVDGSTLFGYMVYTGDKVTAKREPRRLTSRMVVALSHLPGDHHRNWMIPAWVLGLALSGLLWRSPLRRALLFLLIATAVAWVQMALNKGTGGASHHTILLWPFPGAFLGIVFAGVAERIPRYGRTAVVVLIGLLAAGNLLNTNQYLTEFITNGGSGGWTDAIFSLASSIEDKSAAWYGLVDWGYLNGLRVLHEGDLPMFTPDPEGDQKQFASQVSAADFLYIQHTADKQMFPGVNERLRKAAAALGYEEHLERTVADRNGRPVFELFRFRKAEARR